MSSDFTQHQDAEQQRRARRLSAESIEPPARPRGYDLQRRLGCGACGEVWVGVDRKTGRRIAVKFYLDPDREDFPRLAHEVDKLAFLAADRYVVQLLDVGWQATPPYFVMEYVENGSLADLLERRGTLPVHEAVAIFREIAVGLNHAHGKGVLHCDLKPANILLDQDQHPRLADFGQSRLSHERTPSLGTLFFMAPEQADPAAAPDAQWDVYALGAMLYEMLTGSPPHRSERIQQQIEAAADLEQRLACYRRAILESPEPEGHRQVVGIDRALASLIDRCLEKSPADRFPNTQAVLDALAQRRRNAQRRPLLVLGLVGPLLLLAIMLLLYWRGFSLAVAQSETAVREETFRRNQFAAKFVARSFEAEIAEDFEVAERESSRGELHAAMQATLALPEWRELKASPRDPPTSLDPPREVIDRFLANPQRQQLKRYLEQRLADYNLADPGGRPRFSSLFVLDRWGTIVAAAYVDETPTRSVGRNYCWRTYFHGGDEDLPPFRPDQPPPHITATHLSAVFKSTTTNAWKVAVSTPIRFADGGGNPVAGTGGAIDGVLAITVNLGDFAIFRGNADGTSNYFAVLIDNRTGDQHGTILQHPLFETQPPDRDYRVAEPQLATLLAGRAAPFYDPLSLAPAGGAFAGEWIAATQPVKLPAAEKAETAESGRESALLVLVQVEASAATAPVKQLGARLAADALWALLFVASSIAVLWLLVVRLLRRPDGAA